VNHKKGYVTVTEAARSKAAQVPGATIDEGCRCGLVHVNAPAAPPVSSLSRTASLSRAPRALRAPRNTSAPEAVRDAVFDRDRWCVRCGKAFVRRRGGYSIHHLTLRSHGVDNSVEAQILVCGSGTTGCHGWIHAHPAAARTAGWMRLGTANGDSALQPVMVALPSGYGWFLLTPDGKRHGAEAPEGAAA
jgi:hypothetical protein